MTKRIVDESLLRQVLDAWDLEFGYFPVGYRTNAAITALRSALDGDAVGPVAMQPIIKDQHGVLRFKKNGLVDALYEHGVKTGLGLNELHQMEFSDEDRQQFAQLIGYSVSSYGGLSYVTDEAPQPAQMKVTEEMHVAAITALQNALQKDGAANQEPMYYLQDTRGYVGNCPLWWALNGNGYTTDLRKAQKYTFSEAMRQHRSRGSDLPWLCSEIDPLQRPTIDMQDVHKLRSNAEQQKIIQSSNSADGGDA